MNNTLIFSKGLKCLQSLANPTTKAAQIGAAVGGFAGYHMGGAYGAMAARKVAGYYMPKAAVSSWNPLLQAGGYAFNTAVRTPVIEQIGLQGFKYGALAGGSLVGPVVGMVATSLAYEGVKLGISTYQKYKAHEAISQEYRDIAAFPTSSQPRARAITA